jgi:DNA-binding MarR family transcriptional regulator
MRLAEKFVGEYSLAESRVLFVFLDRPDVTVSELRAELGIDGGYLSRILSRFEQEGLVLRTQSESDRRCQHITITETGAAKLASLDARVEQLLDELLAQLGPDEGPELVAHMERIRRLLSKDAIKQWLAGPVRNLV